MFSFSLEGSRVYHLYKSNIYKKYKDFQEKNQRNITKDDKLIIYEEYFNEALENLSKIEAEADKEKLGKIGVKLYKKYKDLDSVKALFFLEKSINFNSPEALYIYCEIYINEKKFSLAETHLHTLINSNDKIKFKSFKRLADLYFEQGELQKMEKYLIMLKKSNADENLIIDANQVLLIYYVFEIYNYEKAEKIIEEYFDEDILYMKKDFGDYGLIFVSLFYDYMKNKFISFILFERAMEKTSNNHIKNLFRLKEAFFYQFIKKDISYALMLYADLLKEIHYESFDIYIPGYEMYFKKFLKETPYSQNIVSVCLNNIIKICENSEKKNYFENVLENYEKNGLLEENFDSILENLNDDFPESGDYFTCGDWFGINVYTEEAEEIDDEIIKKIEGFKKLYISGNKKVDNLPFGIESLFLVSDFNYTVDNLPHSIKYIVFDFYFEQSIDFLPSSVKKILFMSNSMYNNSKFTISDSDESEDDEILNKNVFENIPKNCQIFFSA